MSFLSVNWVFIYIFNIIFFKFVDIGIIKLFDIGVSLGFVEDFIVKVEGEIICNGM